MGLAVATKQPLRSTRPPSCPQCTGDGGRDIKCGRGGTSVVVMRPILRGRNVAVDASAKARVMGALKRRTKPVSRVEERLVPFQGSSLPIAQKRHRCPYSASPNERIPRSPSFLSSLLSLSSVVECRVKANSAFLPKIFPSTVFAILEFRLAKNA